MLIIGAGGHALEVFDVLINNFQYTNENLFFYDDTPHALENIYGFEVIHNREDVLELFKKSNAFSLGVGNPFLREKFVKTFLDMGGELKQVISKSAKISKTQTIFNGDAMFGTFISTQSRISKGVLINAGANIHHEVEIGKFTEVSPKAVLLGAAKIGNYCQIGANVTVLPKIKVGNNSVIGAGAVVTKDIPAHSVVYGVPAKVI